MTLRSVDARFCLPRPPERVTLRHRELVSVSG